MESDSIKREGVVRDKEGNVFIPASRRPDGSVRKARRVKEGYIPQEEVPVYENKGVQWLKSRSNLPPGLAPVPKKDDLSGLSKTAKRHLKRKEKKKQQTSGSQPVTQITESIKKVNLSDQKGGTASGVAPSQGSEVDIKKKIKGLRKKLRQIDDLQAKIDSGELTEPQKEQLEKISRRDALVAEIEDLELELVDV